MHRPRVRYEILPRPGIAREELGRKEIAFQAITRPAREHEVAWNVRATVGERVDVVERREIEFQVRAAVHAATAAIAHGRALDGAFLVSREHSLAAAGDSRGSGKRDTVEMPTS
jgi:hypothetical protein